MDCNVYQHEVPDDILAKENYRTSTNFRWLGSSMKESEELCLTVCGIERCKPDKSFGPTVRRDYHVHFILHGKGYLQINGQTYTVQRGQIFCTPPNVEIFYYADPADPWFYTWISFSGARAAWFLEKAGITTDCPVRECGTEPEEFLALTEKILDHHQLTITNELLRTSILYEIIALLVSSNTALHKQQSHSYDYSQDVYVNAALEYIHHNLARAQVSDIAEYIGISRSYLTRIFKDKLNTAPKEYILNCRLSEASKLLRSTDRSVREIAETVGYTNPFSFSQGFKNMFGISPKHYREHVSDKEK